MGRRRWFRNGNLILLLLSALGVALVAAAEDVTRRLGHSHRRRRKGGTHVKKVT